jgi:hypothetical protein
MSSPEGVLFFYGDHDPWDFIHFQHLRLDNVLTKFLYSKNLINDYDTWCLSGKLLDPNVVDVIEENIWHIDTFDILEDEENAEPQIPEEPVKEKLYERDLLGCYEKYGLTNINGLSILLSDYSAIHWALLLEDFRKEHPSQSGLTKKIWECLCILVMVELFLFMEKLVGRM